MPSDKELFNFYVSQGLAPHQAAAMVGHAVGESNLSPTVQETLANGQKGPGYGLYQWTTPSRKAGLYDFAKSGTGTELDPNDWKTQALYALRELDTTEKGAGDKLYNAQDYAQAVNAGMDFLRPSGYTADNPMGGHNYAGRFNAGAQLAGVQPITGPAIAAAGSSEPSSGILQRAPDIDTEIAQWKGYGAAAQAAKDKAEQEGFSDVIKLGTGLLAPAQQQAAPEAMPQAQAIRPKVGGVAMPNFTQMLAQQRLARRM